MTVVQVNPRAHFDSRPLAQINLAPDALAARYRIDFASGGDDFDDYTMAAIALPRSRGQFWLFWYAGEPEDVTTIYAETTADPRSAFVEVASVLGLTPQEFSWVRADATVPSAVVRVA